MEDAKSREMAVYVSLDLAYISDGLIKDIRQRVHKACPTISVRKIILSATHTHTSLVFDGEFYKHPGGDIMSTEECQQLIAEKATDAIVEAWNERKVRRIGRAFSHAVVGHNRYAVYAGGTGQMYGSTNKDDYAHIGGYEDHSLGMVFTWNSNGPLAGVMLSIPCPSQVDENIEQFSADYWHEIRVELRARLGSQLQVLSLCSAAGDQTPHFLLYGREEAEMRTRRGISERQEIALRVADAVERALSCTLPMEVGETPLCHSVQAMKLTALKVTRDQCLWAEKAVEYWRTTSVDESSWFPVNLKRVIQNWKNKVVSPPFPVEIHVVKIGDLVIASNPFELFLDYGLQIKTRSPAAQTLLVQLAGGRGMYLPSQRALGAGGYGANPVVSSVGPEGGHELVEATLKTIKKMFRS